jgi:hypothetical protein
LHKSKVPKSVLAVAALVLAAAPTAISAENSSSASAGKGVTITEEGRPPWAGGP